MRAALDPSKGFQCVIPTEFETQRLLQVREIPGKGDCWGECGSNRGFAGKCDYCGSNGYCCNPDGRGSCPLWISESVEGFKNKCMVPAGTSNDNHLESGKTKIITNNLICLFEDTNPTASIDE